MDLKTTALAGFDLETTGIDVLDDRIVTASIVYVGPDGQLISNYEWLADPGIRIAQGATDVHGISTERAWAEGDSPGRVVRGILRTMRYFFDNNVPIVTFNGSFDFSMLDAECQRHLNCTFAQAMGGEVPKLLIDSHVIDKTVDKYRKGSRKLTDVAEHYGVPLENAHESFDDSLAATRVAQAMWERFPILQGPTFEELYDLQVEWYDDQMRGLEKYLLKAQQEERDEVEAMEAAGEAWPEGWEPKYAKEIDVSYAWPIH